MPVGLLGRGAAASLPLARAAARKIIAAGGRVLRSPTGRIAAGTAGGIAAIEGAQFGLRGLFPGGGMPRRRRAKGITGAELRGARKVAALVRMYGMRPKSGIIRTRRKKIC